MNQKLALFKDSIKGKTVAVIGIGISNIPVIRLLCQYGAVVTACDKKNEESLGTICGELKRIGVQLRLGENYLEELDAEIIFKTPGMRYDLPQLQQARLRGSIVTSEMEVFFDLCPARIIAVTGSDGKTTTTSLVSELLKKSGYKVWLGGNIGTPILGQIESIQPDDLVVLELSSFQLHTMKASPQIAVITNITPNHLDMHKDMDEYIEAKKNIMRYQSQDGILVTNYDNGITRQISEEAIGNNIYFSRSAKPENGFYLEEAFICYKNNKILDINDILIPGMHNVENYMAAIAAVWDIVDKAAILEVAKNFGGVEHRMELVRELAGVRYYNSSIDSSPNRTKNTLAVFDQKVILISGGKDKGIPYDEIGPVIAEKVKKLILIGATADKIYNALLATGRSVDTVFCSTYAEAVQTAKDASAAGDIVVLSPASTSFDMFNNFEERGNLFKELVCSLT